MLTSVLRHTEEMKGQLAGIERIQSLNSEAIRRIEETQDHIWNKLDAHDTRIRGVEIRQGDRKNAA
jgi:hypothetical protein